MRAKEQIDVAVAVMHYQDRYLLGFRSSKQHQGNRYEFVGGKIELFEHPLQALIREVHEEVGLQLQCANFDIKYKLQPQTQTQKIEGQALINQMGIISHCYKNKNQGDKVVRLHVYRVGLVKAQYESLRNKQLGEEGQPLCWVSHGELLSGQCPLPDANKVILDWLRLPDHLVITYPVADFESIQHWLDFHIHHLPPDACVYVRHKLEDISLCKNDELLTKARDHLSKNSISLIDEDSLNLEKSACLVALLQGLVRTRTDIKLILSVADLHILAQYDVYQTIEQQLVAQHLNQQQLIEVMQTQKQSHKQDASHHLSLFDNLAITVSCHDIQSLQYANQLAAQRIHQQHASIAAAFLSPVSTTKTHPNALTLGWFKFSLLAAQAQMPVVALGGVTPQDLSMARQYGADKVAGIRSFIKNLV
ncbi:thiamine phosphate synthase [Psychrobacter sp. I-STPA10]|uniref:thiamine phosphate synthase n=1 Tax=Psychrobacter sp. I-STPA10 TaxID=2585769 RepID=UPI001E4E1C9C|nr:thiamine phosphate synthase [Psychrobacter sp. I-STPA10]